MTCSSSPYEAAWPPIGPPRTRTLGSHGAMPKRSSCSGLAAKQVVVVGERGRAPFHLAGCLGAQELSHCTPSSTHLLCCRVAIARWLCCTAPSVRIFDIDYGTMHTCGRVGIRFADRCSAIGRGWIVTPIPAIRVAKRVVLSMFS